MAVAARPIEVLVADDELVARQLLSCYLESFGCSVEAVCDGQQALHAYWDRLGRIGLVILDALMPGPSPIQLYQCIRAISPSVPVLFCSGVSSDDPVIRAINEYGLRLLRKPFSRSDLHTVVRNVLNTAGADAPAP